MYIVEQVTPSPTLLYSSYRLNDVRRFLNARRTSHRTDPKLFDEAIYSPYSFAGPRNETDRPVLTSGDLLGVPEILQGSMESENTLQADSSSAQKLSVDLQREPSQDTVRARRPTKRIKRRLKFDGIGQEDIEAEVFIFEYGTVVCWGMTESKLSSHF